ncbi:MAG TPA: trypsin-like serine protease [Solirubrobacteraceae bacterium]|nr:trypsin-like serine protease [Solirubrobacteraceae bacterium]
MRLRSFVCVAGVVALLVGASDAAARTHRRAEPPKVGHAAIIGGAPAAGAAFPWLAEMIDVRGNEEVECTGSVVAPRLILTAGHCVENLRTGTSYPASGFSVMTFTQSPAGGERQLSTVSGVIPYEDFKRRVDTGDAALLALSAPVRAPAITLATSVDAGELQPGTTATIVGWGKTRFTEHEPSRTLRSAGTVVQASTWCTRTAPPFLVTGELCALDAPSYTTGGCSGDSGGPLLIAGANGVPVDVGIAVHVYGRCSTRRPTVFTRIDAIAPWLDSWIAAYAAPSTATAMVAPVPPASSTPPAA